MVSGLAPGSDAVTSTVGKSTCGRGATGSSGYTTKPTRKMPPIRSDVAIGRRTNGSEMLTGMLMSPSVPGWSGWSGVCAHLPADDIDCS